jgi:hypothetical protein
VEIADLYSSKDFINFCKRYTPYFDDLIQDTMIAMISQKEKTQKAIEGGYLLQYAKTIAYFINVGEFRKRKELNKERYIQTLLTKYPHEKWSALDKVVKKIEADMADKDKYINAKVFLYSLEHGSMRKFSKASKISYISVQKMVSEYKQELKQCVKLES